MIPGLQYCQLPTISYSVSRITGELVIEIQPPLIRGIFSRPNRGNGASLQISIDGGNVMMHPTK